MTMIKATPSPVRTQLIAKPKKSCESMKPKAQEFINYKISINCIMEFKMFNFYYYLTDI